MIGTICNTLTRTREGEVMRCPNCKARTYVMWEEIHGRWFCRVACTYCGTRGKAGSNEVDAKRKWEAKDAC